MLTHTLVLSAFAGREFLEDNREELVQQRLPYFGQSVINHAHFSAWARWAVNQGLSRNIGEDFGRKMKEFVKKFPNSKTN